MLQSSSPHFLYQSSNTGSSVSHSILFSQTIEIQWSPKSSSFEICQPYLHGLITLHFPSSLPLYTSFQDLPPASFRTPVQKSRLSIPSHILLSSLHVDISFGVLFQLHCSSSLFLKKKFLTRHLSTLHSCQCRFLSFKCFILAIKDLRLYLDVYSARTSWPELPSFSGPGSVLSTMGYKANLTHSLCLASSQSGRQVST